MRVLITGGAGFIGSHLADKLIQQGHDVSVVDDLSTGRIENLAWAREQGRLRFVEGSTNDRALVDDLMRDADACCHLASAVGVKLVLDQPHESLVRTVRGTDNVFSAATRHGARILYSSSSEVYGRSSSEAVRETDPRVLGPPQTTRWSYGVAKAFGEDLALGLQRELGLETIVVRLFNTSGPRQSGAYGMVLPRFVRQAVAGRDLTVFGHGTQSRCFTHVADTVDAIIRLLAHEGAVGSLFNVGSDHEVSILELARKVIERSGSSSGIAFVPFDRAYSEGFEELGKRKPDTTAVSALTGWRPQFTLDDVIDGVIGHERAMAEADAASAT
jgi:UDP-glucose 4-epimerase